jgi:hypothetical protein
MVLSQTPLMLLELVLFEGAAVAWGVWQLWQVWPRGRDKSKVPVAPRVEASDPPTTPDGNRAGLEKGPGHAKGQHGPDDR